MKHIRKLDHFRVFSTGKHGKKIIKNRLIDRDATEASSVIILHKKAGPTAGFFVELSAIALL